MSLTRSMSLKSAFHHHEQAKKREYGECVCEVETVFHPCCAVFKWKFWPWRNRFL